MEKYKVFGSTPKGDITFFEFKFTKREIVLAIVLFLVFLVCVSMCILFVSSNKSYMNNGCHTVGCVEAGAYLYKNINWTTEPCDDFYSFACDRWIERNPIEGRSVTETVKGKVSRYNRYRLYRILMKPPKHGLSSEKKLKDLFSSCVNDYERIKRKGAPFVTKVLSKIGWTVFGTFSSARWDLTKALKVAHVDFWTKAVFDVRVGQDLDNKTKRIIKVDLSGLGMYYGYYLRNESQNVRDAYKAYMRTVAQLLVRDNNMTLNDATKQRIETFVKDVFEFEKGLANITANTQPSDNPHDRDNRVSLSDLNKKAGAVDWVNFFTYMFAQAGVNSNTKIVLLEKEFVYLVSDYVQTLGANKDRILNNYLVWRLAQTYAQDLSWEYVHANREFYVAVSGRAEFLGTWRFCFYLVSDKMKDALSAMFVRDHFADESKPKVHEMVGYLKTALSSRLQQVTWMDDATRKVAKDKLSSVVDKLGYPDFMMDDAQLDDIYRDLVIDRKTYFQNILNIAKFEKSYWNRRLMQGENRDEWRMATYDIAAQLYNPWNELMVPAGMLQFPLFDKKLPMYMNFGSMGSILAHELINAVDEVGGYYKKDGTIFDWWTNATNQNYLTARKCVTDFYHNKTAGPYLILGRKYSILINGARYARFGVAESGGIRQAYYAYKSWEETNGEEKLPADLHLTKDQAFFVSYAQTNCFVRRDYYSYYYAVRGRVPEDIRTNGALAQLDEFQKAFKCPANSKMNAKKKCNLF
ncbi:endothelin-converting enzyme homolog isoform X2 [Lineus longissimus]|uniref:endothelin-converting enzyme homolog isoform X2 n=1 Tax=Lineus longissimus TaxID=88925 RepID=UPI002B4C61E2